VTPGRTTARNAFLAFLAHAILATCVLYSDNASRGAWVWGWNIMVLLRLVDFPVLWAIDGVLRSFLIVPPEWFRPNFQTGYALNVVLTYVLIGGAFYSALAGSLTLLLVRRASARADVSADPRSQGAAS
jgi:hypothetical protein